MTHDDELQQDVLSTGTSFYTFTGVLGLGPKLRLEYGSDGDAYGESFTPAERREIADEMIRRWTLWAEHGEGGEKGKS